MSESIQLEALGNFFN